MKTNYATEVRELSMQEMREVNGGCCFLKFIIKLLKCCKPKPCKPCKPCKPGGNNPSKPED
ncbi:hypothetical protein [Prevotella sp. 10(H)]|uniref:hypothetical protein n=1 Tax=Prevotella sp. 10(H) TaxID=1158294 RepID=UPI0012DD9556|nr:hypothetical protein [Prevotella sp. 10(H)]